MDNQTSMPFHADVASIHPNGDRPKRSLSMTHSETLPIATPQQRHSSVRVPFRDVDMHGHVHNAAFLSYFEAAINEFLRNCNLACHFRPDSATYAYHVKKAELIFESPAFFEDELQLSVTIARIGRSSLSYTGQIVRGADQTVCARVEIVWVCVVTASRRPCPIPEETRKALGLISGFQKS
jgi:acyl-CoA thioester hydrolase